MTNKLKNKLADIFWDFVANLVDMFQEIRDRVVNQEAYVSVRKIMEEINSNPVGPFFWVVLREDERLLDFSKDQFEKGGVEVVIQKGQYRLERKIVRAGINNTEMPWLVLENTSIGAREAWWQRKSGLNETPLKTDAGYRRREFL